jgi:hypothetical protein
MISEAFDQSAWEEKAAIAEYDGGLSRKVAEALAWRCIFDDCDTLERPVARKSYRAETDKR